MIKSMTGYGRREVAWGAGSVVVELRSVNHRFCEVVVRLPKMLSSLEERLKRSIQQQCQRGRIEAALFLQGHREVEKRLAVDHALAEQYRQALTHLQKKLGVTGQIDLGMLVGVRDIISVTDQPPAEDRRLHQMVLRIMGEALTDLDLMRRREGKILGRDLHTRLGVIAQCKEAIKRRMPLVTKEYFSRMRARVEKVLGDGQIDVNRLHQELAVFADRCDVTEEMIRLDSHVKQFEGLLKAKGSVGKTMDFLLQEMGREINTTGSKGNDAQVSMQVLKIKGELEKIREQVQNIE